MGLSFIDRLMMAPEATCAYYDCVMLIGNEEIDWRSQRENIKRERMGRKPAKTHIFWYVFCRGEHRNGNDKDRQPLTPDQLTRQDFARRKYSGILSY